MPGAGQGQCFVKRFVGLLRGRGLPRSKPEVTTEPDVTANPTSIRISKRMRTALILATLALLGLVIWQVPTVLTTVVGGLALALALSFPVRWLSRLMPRGRWRSSSRSCSWWG